MVASERFKFVAFLAVVVFVGVWGSLGDFAGGVVPSNWLGLPSDVVDMFIVGALLVFVSLADEVYWRFKVDEFASFWFRLEAYQVD